jgi:hypothetical protein
MEKRLSALCALLCLFASDAYALQTCCHTEIAMGQPAGQCKSFEKFVTPATGTFCALTGSGGLFARGGENGKFVVENGGWVFKGNSCQPGVFFTVDCIKP